jgi:hypothetical protein
MARTIDPGKLKLIDLSQLRLSESVRRQRRFLAPRRVQLGRLYWRRAKRTVCRVLVDGVFFLGINAAVNLDTNSMTLTGVRFCIVIITSFF